MNDVFKVVDCVFDKVDLSGFATYKDKALESVVSEGVIEYLVINTVSTPYNRTLNQFMLNVNINVPKPENGMINRKR